MSPLVPHSSAARVWARLEAVGLVPDFDEETSRLLVALYRT